VTVIQSTFAENQSDGGTLSMFNGTLNIRDSRFTRNEGSVHAGGIAAFRGIVSISRSTLDHNFGSNGGGGALDVGGGTTLEVTDSAFIENTSEDPAITLGGPDTTAIFTNTTFARNALHRFFSGSGRGIAIHNFSAKLSLINSTLADNGSTGGINSALFTGEGAITILANTIIANNTSQFSQDCAGAATSVGNNIIGDLSGCAIVLQPGDLTGDPGLGTFTDNGTPGNGHFPLLPTSRAIDTANDSICPKKDQIGQQRKPHCDIGAIEFSDKPPHK
jgi:hypothetical protein